MIARNINNEFNKLKRSYGLYVCIAYGFFLAVAEFVWSYHNIYQGNGLIYNHIIEQGDFYSDFYETGILECWIGCESYSIYNQLFIKTIPLIAAIPFSYSLKSEWDNGYSAQVIVKTKRSNYFTSKLIAIFLSGMIVVMIPEILSLLISAAFVPAIAINPASYQTAITVSDMWFGLSQNYPVLYAILFSLIDGCFGGLYALLATAVSLIISNRFVSILFPLFLHLSLSYLWMAAGLDLKYIPEAFLNPDQGGTYSLSFFVILIIYLSVSFILSCVFYIELHKLDEI